MVAIPGLRVYTARGYIWRIEGFGRGMVQHRWDGMWDEMYDEVWWKSVSGPDQWWWTGKFVSI